MMIKKNYKKVIKKFKGDSDKTIGYDVIGENNTFKKI